MFHSINAYTGETLCRRPAQGYAEFAQELAALKLRQQAFARLGVTGRTALLQAFAERLAQNKERLADAACMNAVPNWINRSSSSDITSALPPSCWRIRPLLRRRASVRCVLSRWVLCLPSCRGTILSGRFCVLPFLPCARETLVPSNPRPALQGSALRCWNWFQTTSR